jgi:hypothetical protein
VKRKSILVMLLLISIAVFSYIIYYKTQSSMIDSPSQMKGTVYSFNENYLTVVEDINDVNNAEKLWADVNSEVMIYSLNKETVIFDGNSRKVNISNLKKGQLIEVWDTGFVNDSFPGQAVAKQIVIIE